MKTVTINKDELRKKLETNRFIHLNEYNEALEAYHQAVIAALQLLMDDAQQANSGKGLKTNVDLQEPRKHIDEYDKAISMLDWEVSDNVELDQREFSKFVCDEWDWTDLFKTVNATYNGF